MIGLTEEETNMVFDEFEIIDKNINKINEIENINEIEPMTHALDNFDYVLREDVVEDSISKDEFFFIKKEFSFLSNNKYLVYLLFI